MTTMNRLDKYFEKEEKGAKGLYVHIPFCHKKCYYCDFLTFPGQEKRMDSYISNLLKEMEIYQNKYGKILIDSVFLGGGSPSYLSLDNLDKLLKGIHENFNLNSKIEFTIEMNPEDVRQDKLKILKDYGVNRISLGVQTFDENILKILGRVHKSSDVIEAIDLLNKNSFANINLDMIYSLPLQEEKNLENDLKIISYLSPNHLSYYSLILEENTYLHRLVRENKISLNDDEMDRNFYHKIVTSLEEIGLKRYEISNFAKESYESVHNKKYWQMKEVLGIGMGASGFYKKARYKNVCNFKKYGEMINDGVLPIGDYSEYNLKELRTDYIITNMRLKEGINLKNYEEIFGISLLKERERKIKEYLDEGFLILMDNNLFFSLDGVDISNHILVDLI
ncbi:radical SAM family heme chaperone HemW [Citroniella saccharovorans]|uniref:Heme chaperone HemW n=2 Tax=Citroniella saccharovorans TaxID=2053367 RepID=A0AAW9MV40_9FIRM|nr:radical SAM family heme chaperone HemW [Citroniella saccharovorans]